MTTTAITGFGGHLANGGVAGAAYTNVGQLKKFAFSALKAEFDDITNLDSPAPGGAVYKEWLKVLIDGGSVQFNGVLNPADATTQALMTNLAAAGNTALVYWKITLSNGTSTVIFQAFVEEFKFENEYNKSVPFSGSLKIAGPLTIAW